MAESVDLLALAVQYVCTPGEACSVVETWKVRRTADAPGADAIHPVQRRMSVRLMALQQLLAREFGDPAELGQGAHPAVARDDVVQFRIWRVNGKTLYLATAQAIPGSDWIVLLGVRAGSARGAA